MAGYWPRSFLRVHTKKRTRPISNHLDRTSLVNKGFTIWDKEDPKNYLRGNFSCGTQRHPERARYRHLARSGSQSQRRIWFILPAHGTSHIINVVNVLIDLVGGLEYLWLKVNDMRTERSELCARETIVKDVFT